MNRAKYIKFSSGEKVNTILFNPLYADYNFTDCKGNDFSYTITTHSCPESHPYGARLYKAQSLNGLETA